MMVDLSEKYPDGDEINGIDYDKRHGEYQIRLIFAMGVNQSVGKATNLYQYRDTGRYKF